MNYGELKLSVASYMHRNDLTAEIPGFIDIAINRMNNGVNSGTVMPSLRVREMITIATINPTSNPFLLPSDFLEMRELSRATATGRLQLTAVGRHELNTYATTGTSPTLYTIDGFNCETRAPATDIEFQIIYFAKIQKFVSDTDTSDLLDEYSQIFLYGALVEANSWIQDNEQQSKTTDMFVSSINAANTSTANSDLGESPQMQGASRWV